ncbi:MAG: sulfur carrier protein ThiS [Pseudomonadota bacterium]
MQLIVNGTESRFDAPLNVAGLLESLSLEPRKIAVELNLEIVPRSTYSERQLQDGDRIEIVQFVGGG